MMIPALADLIMSSKSKMALLMDVEQKMEINISMNSYNSQGIYLALLRIATCMIYVIQNAEAQGQSVIKFFVKIISCNALST